MSLITVNHGLPNVETIFVGCGGDLKEWVTQYVQYVDGKPVARFKVRESFFKWAYATNVKL